MDQSQCAVVLFERVDHPVERIGKMMSRLRIRCQVHKLALSHPRINLVSAGTKFLGPELVSPRVPIVIAPDFLVTVEANWDAVVLVVGAARGFVDDMCSFDVH